MIWEISSNYGTFSIYKRVEAPDRDAALEMCGIMQDLMEAGWHFHESPDGEEHSADLLPTIHVTKEQRDTLYNIKTIFDNNTSVDGWDIGILEDVADYLLNRGIDVNS